MRFVVVALAAFSAFSGPLMAEETTTTKKDILTMTMDELNATPAVDIQAEIDRLTALKTTLDQDLPKIEKENLALCQRFAQLLKECPAYQYVLGGYYTDDLSCTSDTIDFSANPVFDVNIAGETIAATYVLEIDGKYRSDEFKAPGGTITFKAIQDRDKTKKPIRFVDMTDFTIKAIQAGSSQYEAVIPAASITPLDKLKVTFSVDGKALMSTFALSLPDSNNASVDSSRIYYYRINPNGVQNLGRDKNYPECEVTEQDIKIIQEAAQ